MKQLPQKSSPGFALLLTLVVVSVIGVVAFGVGRLTLSEFKQGLQFQDSQDALESAEAGVEDGLVRFRYDRNTEVPTQAFCASSGAQIVLSTGDTTIPEPTDTTNYVLRVNLTTGKLQCLNAHLAANPDPSQHVYDLKIYYKAKTLDGSKSPIVEKDQTYQIGGITNSPTLTLTAKDAASTSVNCAQSTSQSAIPPYLQIEYSNNDGNTSQEPLILQKTNADPRYRAINGIGLTVDAQGTSAVELKPLNDCIRVGGSVANDAQPIDFGTSIVEADGYFNGTKRKLASYLNRSTGTTNSVSNYVIFSGTGSLGQ